MALFIYFFHAGYWPEISEEAVLFRERFLQ
jgi:hypothetical protein